MDNSIELIIYPLEHLYKLKLQFFCVKNKSNMGINFFFAFKTPYLPFSHIFLSA